MLLGLHGGKHVGVRNLLRGDWVLRQGGCVLRVLRARGLSALGGRENDAMRIIRTADLLAARYPAPPASRTLSATATARSAFRCCPYLFLDARSMACLARLPEVLSVRVRVCSWSRPADCRLFSSRLTRETVSAADGVTLILRSEASKSGFRFICLQRAAATQQDQRPTDGG
jgi:hypothetical protein